MGKSVFDLEQLVNGNIDTIIHTVKKCGSLDSLNDNQIEDIIYKNINRGLIALDKKCIEVSVDKAYLTIVPAGFMQDDGKEMCISFFKTNANKALSYKEIGSVDSIVTNMFGTYKSSDIRNRVAELKEYFSVYRDIRGKDLDEIKENNSIENLSIQVVEPKGLEEPEVPEEPLQVDNQANKENENLESIKPDLEKPVTESVESIKTEPMGIEEPKEQVYGEQSNIDNTKAISYTVRKDAFKLSWKEMTELVHSSILKEDKRSKVYFTKNFISSVIRKVEMDIKNNYVNGYKIIGNSVIINTGLLDTMYNSVYIAIRDINKIGDVENNKFAVPRGKIALYEMYDTVIECPEPVKFYKNKEELLFKGSLKTFDIENYATMAHIISRRHRLPEKYSKCSDSEIGIIIQNALIRTMKVAERREGYLIPMYSFKYDLIQWLAPLYLDGEIGSKPDVVAIIGNKGDWNVAFTIIEPSVAYNNAKLIYDTDSRWISSCIE